MRMLILPLVIVLLSASQLPAISKVYVEGVDGYTGCEDTYMIEYRVESNYGDAIYIECQSEDGRDGGSRMKPLIRFNHLGLAGCTVRACTLQLYCYLSITDYQAIQLHEMLRDWREFQTTCLDYRTDSPWADFACGCNDLDASSSYVCSIVDSGGTGWKSFPLPPSLVQKWADAPGDTNNGLLVLAPEEMPGYPKDRSFRSSDMFVFSQRPRLIVDYDSCGTELKKHPVLLAIADVPGDHGGSVRIMWSRSTYDESGSDPSIKCYKIYRKRQQTLPPLLGEALDHATPELQRAPSYTDQGPIWEMVGRLGARGACTYAFEAETYCDSTGAGICWNQFYVSACTAPFGQHFDSPVGKGYSVNNLLGQQGGSAEATDDVKPGQGVDSGETHLEILGSNPASGGFLIGFRLARPDYVRIAVYDVAGRVVETLLDDRREAGPHSISWNSSGGGKPAVSSGVYIVKLVTSTESRGQKIVVLR